VHIDTSVLEFVWIR